MVGIPQEFLRDAEFVMGFFERSERSSVPAFPKCFNGLAKPVQAAVGTDQPRPMLFEHRSEVLIRLDGVFEPPFLVAGVNLHTSRSELPHAA